MAQKKYAYKHLTDEMKKTLDGEIRKLGRDKLYEKVEHNIMTERVINLQNQPGAFDEIQKGPWRTTKWEQDLYSKPTIVDMDNLDLGQEMLYYIDRKRFLLL